ncbi:MAG TPA: erythromycin esterase family protein [Caulobacteraceae bacterium]|nr:erythromycin esterase family protein [Caulobacteraceae bacterium]
MDDMGATVFKDRAEAGRRLGQVLAARKFDAPIVYALPRGGVPVALEIARALNAPLDLVLVRKIGAPHEPELALAAVVDGHPPQTVINPDVQALTGADEAYLDRERTKELAEIERRRERYLKGRPRLDPKGRTAVVVDDGLATGATAKAALRALRQQGAGHIVLAVPVAPDDTASAMEAEADEVICLNRSDRFWGVGQFYRDFHQLGDEEMIAMLDKAPKPAEPAPPGAVVRREARIAPQGLGATVTVPKAAHGVVLFAHGSGSSRFSPRNTAVAEFLNAGGFATVLMDLLTDDEAADRRNVFDIPLLAERLGQAADWIASEPDLQGLRLGLFGASTGAAAALVAAARLQGRIAAVVSRGGRPDLAGADLPKVTAPTLLIVGGDDDGVIDLNREALAQLVCEKVLTLVPGATHLFEEPGTLEQVMLLAREWFEQHLPAPRSEDPAADDPPPPSAPARRAPQPASADATIVERIAEAAEPFDAIDDAAFAALFDRFGDAKVVLLGEASHGTSEFYRARAAITRRLVERHGFNIVAVEADWPDAAAIDRHVRRLGSRPMDPPPFSRFPTWMWRNREVAAFTAWLREHNDALAGAHQTAFYGLDLYNMNGAIAAVLEYLDRVDPQAAAEARRRYGCLAPWSAEFAAYGRASLTQGYALCEGPVVDILKTLLKNRLAYAGRDGEAFFDAAQNAQLVADAERYYRVMYYGDEESWNLRDRHMFQTLERILVSRGPAAKAVVWAHNSHIGDARFTDMGMERGELNIGQLCKTRWGRQAVSIGFSCHAGEVMAAPAWDEPGEVMTVLPSRPDSFENLMHGAGLPRFLLDLREGVHAALRADLVHPRLERYIGVIYRPQTERFSHYGAAQLAEQYDALVWFDETSPVTPLERTAHVGEDDTWPFGL